MTDHEHQNKHGVETWDNTLPLELYTDWFNIIKNDDVSEYDNAMAALNEQKEKLVNGYFAYPVHKRLKVNIRNNRDYCADFYRPLVLAAAFGSRGVFVKLIQDGAVITQTEQNGCNIIHAMIIATAEYRDREGRILDMYLDIRQHTEVDILKMLLSAESDDHMLPVELAVRLGAFGIFRAIVETQGVYENPAGEIGLTTYATYDIDVYENHRSWRREIRSPLRLLRYMENDHMASFLEYDIIQMPIIKAWSQRKKLQSLPFIVLWFLCKAMFLIFNIFMDPRVFKVLARGGCSEVLNVSNITHWACSGKFVKPESQDPNFVLRLLYYFTGFAMLFSTIFLLYDLVEFITRTLDREGRLLRRVPQKSPYVAYTVFYRVCQTVLCLNGVIGGIWLYIVDPFNTEGILYLKAMNLPFILMGVLYLLEPLPIFGYFAITLQRMITAMLKFTALQALIEVVFTIFFMSAETHMPSFKSIDIGIYSMFLLSQNILNFGFTPAWYTRISHYLHHFMGNILLMNYLIAVMSSLISTNNKEKKAIQLIRVLDVCFLVEDRYTRWLWKLLRKFKHFHTIEITVSK
jgi:hypothetical protein